MKRDLLVPFHIYPSPVRVYLKGTLLEGSSSFQVYLRGVSVGVSTVQQLHVALLALLGNKTDAKMATILPPFEAEIYIRDLELITPDMIGSSRFLRLHERTEKLNMQAVLNATNLQDEYVKEFLVSYNKMPVLVHNVISMEIWKKRVLPSIINILGNEIKDFTIPIAIHHELCALTLIETTLFHADACENVDQAFVDLVDYCHRRLILLIERFTRSVTDKEPEQETLEELEKKVGFKLGMKSMTILRYAIENLTNLPLGVTNRILQVHDMPVTLATVLEREPWVRGELIYDQDFEGGWRKATCEDRVKINKTQAQPWISLLILLTDRETWKKYELNNYRKNRLLKLRPLLTENLIDQLPVLTDLKRFLEQLFVFNPPAPKNGLILELSPMIWESMSNKEDGYWESIARKQCVECFCNTPKQIIEKAKLLDALYDADLEHFSRDK